MLRTFARNTVSKAPRASAFRPVAFQVRTMADKSPIEEATQAAGEAKGTNPKVRVPTTHPYGSKLTLTLRSESFGSLFRWCDRKAIQP